MSYANNGLKKIQKGLRDNNPEYWKSVQRNLGLFYPVNSDPDVRPCLLFVNPRVIHKPYISRTWAVHDSCITAPSDCAQPEKGSNKKAPKKRRIHNGLGLDIRKRQPGVKPLLLVFNPLFAWVMNYELSCRLVITLLSNTIKRLNPTCSLFFV